MARPARKAALPPIRTVTRRKTPSECSSDRNSGIEKSIAILSACHLPDRALSPPAAPAHLKEGRFPPRPPQHPPSGPVQRNRAVDHDVTAMRKLQGVERVLLH